MVVVLQELVVLGHRAKETLAVEVQLFPQGAAEDHLQLVELVQLRCPEVADRDHLTA